MRTTIAIVAIGGVFTMLSTSHAQTNQGKAKVANPDPALAAAAIYPKPSELHKQMVKLESGIWDATMKTYFAGPDQPAQEFKAMQTVRATVDELFALSEFESDFLGGKKYKGHGIWGYDTHKKKVVGAWVDNLGTSINSLEGDYDSASKKLTMWCDRVNQLTGLTSKEKHVTEYKDDGRKVWTMYATVPGSGDQMVKVLEAEFNRRSGSTVTKTATSR